MLTPSLHAHTHMAWTDRSATCRDCGQVWLLDLQRGWQPAPVGTDPDTITEDWGAA